MGTVILQQLLLLLYELELFLSIVPASLALRTVHRVGYGLFEMRWASRKTNQLDRLELCLDFEFE